MEIRHHKKHSNTISFPYDCERVSAVDIEPYHHISSPAGPSSQILPLQQQPQLQQQQRQTGLHRVYSDRVLAPSTDGVLPCQRAARLYGDQESRSLLAECQPKLTFSETRTLSLNGHYSSDKDKHRIFLQRLVRYYLILLIKKLNSL